VFRKICIYGVGAIGGWMGAGLAALEGVQVSAVARGRTLAALQANGQRPAGSPLGGWRRDARGGVSGQGE